MKSSAQAANWIRELLRLIWTVPRQTGCFMAWGVCSIVLTNPAGLWSQSGSTQLGDHAVEVQMRNVNYHFNDLVAVDIRKLHGNLIPQKGELPVFEDKNSFLLKVDSAEIAISPDSLANVLNSYVFAKSDAPLKKVSIAIDAQERLKIKGKLHNKGDVGFETEGRISNTTDGKLRIHVDKVKVLHFPVKGLMDLLGIEISDLIKTGKVRGVTAEEDDLILDPPALLPPPHIAGQISAVRLEKDSLVQIFGTPQRSLPLPVTATNYMCYRGNQLRFGKLTMNDTDMILIDMDPADPFDFYLDHYREQLVAGYTKETPTFGLRVYMRDYNKLRRIKSTNGSPSQGNHETP